ncbi:MAG: hypothetical protein Hyperionvirus2_221 [Hyperionvirus sp.]|uniref:Uncharacterized protein n=1 Tax=Hyperionvirus sp. TaxID=2487770 RepID=A0A3G5AAH9_9VIRU|nr:MAG: hypothetical protein Hyperionvirus2_221 [Hyperionvirus sp.]
MAAEVKRFVFNAAFTPPDLSCITVEGAISLIDRLSSVEFVVSALTDGEFMRLIGEIVLLPSYHRGLVEHLLVQRIDDELKAKAIWERLMKSEDGNTIAFLAQYCDSDKIVGFDKREYYVKAYAKGERYYSTFGLAKNSVSFETMFKSGIMLNDTESKKDVYTEATIQLLKEGVLAGNRSCHHILQCYLGKSGDDFLIMIDLKAKELLIGKHFSGVANFQESKSFFDMVEPKNVPTTVQKLLESSVASYIAVENKIESKQMDRFYFRRENAYSSWEKREMVDHKEFLKLGLQLPAELLGKEGIKMINDYPRFSHKGLTAEILFFLGTYIPEIDPIDYVTENVDEAYNMVVEAAQLGNVSAYKFLTTPEFTSERQKIMYEKFRTRALVREIVI